MGFIDADGFVGLAYKCVGGRCSLLVGFSVCLLRKVCVLQFFSSSNLNREREERDLGRGMREKRVCRLNI